MKFQLVDKSIKKDDSVVRLDNAQASENQDPVRL